MRYIKTEQLKSGEILAKDLVDSRGNVLLKASNDMIISDHLISRLKERNIRGIYINDQMSDGIEIEESISGKMRYMAIDALEKKDVEQTQVLAKSIVEDFKSTEIDLNRIVGETSYYERAINICDLCLSLGKRLEMNEEELSKLVASALLSDIGLILNEQEKEKILDDELKNLKKLLLQLPISETYPILGRYAVSQAYADPIIIHSVYYHKENEDGTGIVQNFYKKMGINANCDIRDSAKIIHVCSDYVDALIKEDDFIKARNKIEQGIIDNLYNYNIAKTFLRFIPIYPIGTVVKLSNGEEAIVTKNNEGYPLMPVVRLSTGEEVNLTQTLNVVIDDVYVPEDINKRL